MAAGNMFMSSISALAFDLHNDPDELVDLGNDSILFRNKTAQ